MSIPAEGVLVVLKSGKKLHIMGPGNLTLCNKRPVARPSKTQIRTMLLCKLCTPYKLPGSGRR